MLIITGSDATLYHYPFATVGLILLNTAIYLLQLSTGGDPTGLTLAYGVGLHPLQWVTNLFLHADMVHLIGNMLFLWPFGLLIEGKVGPFRFLILFLLIGIALSGIEQAIMLGDSEPEPAIVENVESPGELSDQLPDFVVDEVMAKKWAALSDEEKAELLNATTEERPAQIAGYSLGAAAAIFGLLGLCSCWAPVNEYVVASRWGGFEVPVMFISGLFIFKELTVWSMSGQSLGIQSLHLLGMVFGLMIGLVMLRYGMADCEGRDIVSVISGNPIKPKKLPFRRKKREAKVDPNGPKKASDPSLMRADVVEHEDYELAYHPQFDPPPIVDNGDQLLDEIFGTESSSRRDAETPIVAALDDGQFLGALNELVDARQRIAGFMPSVDSANRLIIGLVGLQRFGDVIAIIQLALDAYPNEAASLHLLRAQIALAVEKNAIQAADSLKQIDPQTLNAKQQQQYRTYLAHIKEMQV